MRAIRSMTKEERKAMDSEIRRRCVEICNQYEIDYDTIMIYVQHFYKGWGDKRIRDFHRVLIKEREELKKFYEADDEDPYIHFFAMREKLKADGIDVEAIRNDLMKEAGIE